MFLEITFKVVQSDKVDVDQTNIFQSKLLLWHSDLGNPKKPGLQSLHFSPIALALQKQNPFESHEVDVDPRRLQLQAKAKNMFLV